MTSTPLTAAERATLNLLADVLIPEASGHLSASQAGLGGTLLTLALSYAPDVADGLRGVINAAEGLPPETALQAFSQRDPAGYDAFCETVAAIYFLSPQVRVAVGFPGREAKAARVEVADLENLLMPVIEAGFAPRAIPRPVE